MSHSSHSSQFALLKQRRFGPFFWTQFLGAFNDNLFKTALLVVLTYDALGDGVRPDDLLDRILDTVGGIRASHPTEPIHS